MIWCLLEDMVKMAQKRKSKDHFYLYPTNRRIYCKVRYHLFQPIYFFKHRGIHLDINIVVFIKDSFTNLQNPVLRIIISTNPRVINQYKKELLKIQTKHNTNSVISHIKTFPDFKPITPIEHNNKTRVILQTNNNK